ncbi:MAG: cytochrome c biogenesis CcdA family protein [Saccharofermentanales bacterium]
MEYILSFLEGIITFISPCILPMFPIYLSYFAGNTVESDLDPQSGGAVERKPRISPVVKNVVGFVIGFTLVFTALGTFAGSVGRVLNDYSVVVNIIGGSIIILFGLHFTGLVSIPILDRSRKIEFKARKLGFISSVLFGIVFSIGWTPCVGVFLGSALMLAASQDSVFRGTSMLFAYSLGLAVPFLLSAIFIERLKSTFIFIKKHYRIINLISGILLVIVGIMMMFGWLGYLMALLTF